MNCPNCGAELSLGAKFCGKCGAVLGEMPRAHVVPETKSVEPARVFTGANRMPQGIALSTGERVVKQYQIGRYTLRKGSIDVIVTNKRVIRYEESILFKMQNTLIDEINLEDVHGTSTHMRRSISILGLVIAALLLIGGIILVAAGSNNRMMGAYVPIGILMILIAAIIIFQSLKPTLEFCVLGSVGDGALGTVVNQRGRLFRNDSRSVVFQFKPTKETTIMLQEIGACIYDLRTLGDKAIEKWS